MRVKKGHQTINIKDPEQTIVDGFHIHMDYLPGQKHIASELFDIFKKDIVKQGIIYSALDTYPENSNGPHVRAGWEIKFEKTGPRVFDRYGYALAWLMLNHGEIPIYSHAKTWIYGENEERLISHLDYSLYAGAASSKSKSASNAVALCRLGECHHANLARQEHVGAVE